MKTDRISSLRQRVAEQGGAMAEEVHAALTWALSLNGPVALADKASWEMVRAVASDVEMDGHTWYWSNACALPDDELDEVTWADLGRAVRYLADRELLIGHHMDPYLVRACPALEALCS